MEKLKIRLECKFRKGAFASFGTNEDPKKSFAEIAKEYAQNPIRTVYAIPMVAKGGRGAKGKVKIALYEREAIFNAIERFIDNGRESAPALGMVSRGVGIVRVEELAVRRTFGRPIEVLETEFSKIADIPRDVNCPNAPQARSWEKLTAELVNGVWVGGLRNVQYDVVIVLD